MEKTLNMNVDTIQKLYSSTNALSRSKARIGPSLIQVIVLKVTTINFD